jgi:hypothetical protein
MASPKPAVIVRREFETTPDIVAQQLRACIIGPSCQLVRYGTASEKATGFLAAYTTLGTDNITTPNLLAAAVDYVIPGVADGAVIDSSYTKLFIEDAYLNYATVTTTFTRPEDNTILGPTWKASPGNSRSSLIPQDVAVGDIITFYSDTGGTLTKDHESVVTGFISAAPNNTISAPAYALQISSANSTESTAAVGLVGVAGWVASGAFDNYMSTDANQVADPRRVGKKTTAYTITVTANNGTAVDFSVTTDTGLDDAFFSAKILGNTAVLPSGLILTVPALNGIPAGHKTTFNATVEHSQASVATVKSGTVYKGTQSTVYSLTCTEGGAIKTGVKFRVTTNNGYDAPQNITVQGATATAIDVAIGSYEITLNITGSTTYGSGFLKGDVMQVVVSAGASGAITKLVFADSTDKATVPDVVRLSKKKTVDVPAFYPDGSAINWRLKNAEDPVLRRLEVGSAAGTIVVRDASVPNVDCYVIAGKAYVQYRAFKALPREVGSVNTLSDITTQLGVVDPDNLLAYAVYKAWTNANGATVHFIPTVSQTLNGTRGFADALAVAKGVRNCYSLVPLTTNSEIWNAFVGHVNQQSAAEVGNFRILWIAPETESHFRFQSTDSAGQMLTGSTSTASYNSATGSIDFNTSNGISTKFAETLQVGDFIRTNFNIADNGTETFVEYRIKAIVDNNTVVLAVASNPVILANSRFEVFRDLTSNALAQEYVKISGGFSSERVFAVVPDRGISGMKSGGVSVKNWNVAAAFAGLRSGSRPQQPLSNVELLGFDGSNTNLVAFDEDDMAVLRDGGVWVVRNTEDGKIYAERQLSTSTIDLFRKEQSVTSNVDSISFTLGDALRDLVGRVNITDRNTGLVRSRIVSIFGELSSDAGSATVGPQLTSYTINSITVPETAQDTVKVSISIGVPLPMNTIDITLVI